MFVSALALFFASGIFACSKTAIPDLGTKPPSAAAPLRFGVAPAVCDERTQKEYDVLVQQMSRALGRPVQLFVAKDYDELGQAVLHGGLPLAQVSNYLYISASPKAVTDAHLAALAFEHGLTLCTADGGFARFSDLRWENPIA